MEPSSPLRSVPPSDPSAGKRRREARTRPTKPLPTDRTKIEVQLKLLQAFARLGVDGRPISNEALSSAVNNEISHHSVGLSHRFFVECGWLIRVGRGDYAASAALVDYGRRLGIERDDQRPALSILQEAVRTNNGWFWPIVQSMAVERPARLSEVMVALMTATEVGQDHRPQVKMLLDWLALIDLISIENDTLTVVDHLTLPPLKSAPIVTVDVSDDAPGQPAAAGSTLPKPTTREVREPDSRQQPVLAFSFSFSFTADDLAKLSPEQIRETFAAAGTLMSIKK